MPDIREEEDPRQTQSGSPPCPKTIDARELFRGEREVWIEHAGVRYRLRITRRNRLLLQR